MKAYSSAVLIAVLLLATPGESFFDATQSWGRPKPGDLILHSPIKKLGTNASYKAILRTQTEINAVQFRDIAKTGPTIWINKEPPCLNPELSITPRDNKGFHVIMDVFYSKT